MTGSTDLAARVHIDAYGVTDTGRQRPVNEDHFVIAELSKSVAIQYTSISPEALARRVGLTGAHLFAVADGVGGRPDGDVASERTVTHLLDFFGRTAACFQGIGEDAENALLEGLESAVRGAHLSLKTEGEGKAPATTLTMLLLVWPRAYVIHVGDSRAYVSRKGRMQRLTRDQTFGEYMVSVGAWSQEQARRPGLAATLSSAIGGDELTPAVGLIDLDVGDTILLCTDGLTKHVPDDRLAEILRTPMGSASMCRQLVDEALEAGGSDNVTVLVIRSERR